MSSITQGAALDLKLARASVAAPKGFTLIEILVTVVVIALGCLAVTWLQAAAMQGNASADHLTTATFLAESEIERLKALTLQEVANEAGMSSPPPEADYCDPQPTQPCWRRAGLNRRGEQDENGRGAYTREVSYFLRRPTSLSHQIEVRVEWRDSHGPRHLEYTAALTDFTFQ